MHLKCIIVSIISAWQGVRIVFASFPFPLWQTYGRWMIDTTREAIINRWIGRIWSENSRKIFSHFTFILPQTPLPQITAINTELLVLLKASYLRVGMIAATPPAGSTTYLELTRRNKRNKVGYDNWMGEHWTGSAKKNWKKYWLKINMKSN